MQPYQEEYIENVKEVMTLFARKKPGNLSFEDYEAELNQSRRQVEQKVQRNMELLRTRLYPLLDHLLEAEPAQIAQLQEFAEHLSNQKETVDISLFCQIHQALLNLARLTKDQNGMIRELYWLGIGRNSLCGKLVGLELNQTEKYISAMRLCFTEAAAYLKYYEEIQDSETRAYILRSRANMSLGKFKSAHEKIYLVKQTLQILQDKYYQEKEPGLPWERYIYMTHQQMAASISYSKESPMTPDDIASAMESVYLVYQRRLQEAADNGQQPPLRPAFSYYAIEYYCGLDTLEGLLTKMEKLMDAADSSDFSADNMYALISLPAFYCQYLQQYPERIPERKEYIASLYTRILDYMDAFPEASENETLFFYLRQLSLTYLETEDSLPYGKFLQKLLIRFAPDIYIHSYIVGRTASFFCGIILSEEPAFFDDIEQFQAIQDPEEKRRKVLDFAMNCGLFHDVGKINFLNLYSQTARQWFEEEYEMAHLHTTAGEACLSGHDSTSLYAPAALGHHSWYDGSRGYPESYRRLSCPFRQMVDVIGLMDWLENVTGLRHVHTGVEKSFDEAVADAIALESRRFSPLLTARLRDKDTAAQLQRAFAEGRREAYRRLYLEEGH